MEHGRLERMKALMSVADEIADISEDLHTADGLLAAQELALAADLGREIARSYDSLLKAGLAEVRIPVPKKNWWKPAQSTTAVILIARRQPAQLRAYSLATNPQYGLVLTSEGQILCAAWTGWDPQAWILDMTLRGHSPENMILPQRYSLDTRPRAESATVYNERSAEAYGWRPDEVIDILNELLRTLVQRASDEREGIKRRQSRLAP